MNAKVFSPLDEEPCFSVGGQGSVASRITRLFFVGYPVTVFWGVVSLVIAAIQFVFIRRRFSYILKKYLKIIPLRTNPDSSTTVIDVGLTSRISTSRQHIRPDSVDTRPRPTVFLRTARHARQCWRLFIKQMILTYVSFIATTTAYRPISRVPWQLFQQGLLTYHLSWIEVGLAARAAFTHLSRRAYQVVCPYGSFTTTVTADQPGLIRKFFDKGLLTDSLATSERCHGA